MKFFATVKDFIKKETVLVVAWVLAIASMLVVNPDKEYIDYIDFRTLGILFCLMAVMAGLKKCGLFKLIAEKLLKLAGSERSLEIILVMLCFFFSMLITNDVALITFVPLALEVLAVSERRDRVIPVVVMQTIAANLGSMATPVGNPQNLFLYTKSGMSIGKFFGVMMPYTLLAFVLIIAAVFIINKNGQKNVVKSTDKGEKQSKNVLVKEFIYIVMFLLCILVVLKIIPLPVMVVATIVLVLIMDRKVILQIDYSLLITFVGFFIFVGNMGRITQFQQMLDSVLTGHEFIVSALLSQVVSNVPAAILLSGFTTKWEPLLVGVNVGGLGTLIASMASLISFKFVAREYSHKKGRYMVYFTIVNVIFFVIMAGAYYIAKCL